MTSENTQPGKLSICVIGLGWGYRHHAKNFSGMDDVDLYVCDVDAAKVDRSRREFNVVGAFSSIDAVDVALPHHMHRPVFAVECREFVDWVRSGGDSPINGAEGRKDLEIVQAAYRSAESGEAVRLPL